MAKKLISVHARYIDKEGWPKSLSYDEEEFNDGSIDFTEAIDGLIAEGAVKIELEIEVEP